MTNLTIGNPFYSPLPARRRVLSGLLRMLRDACPPQPLVPRHVPKHIWDRHSALLVAAGRCPPQQRGVRS